MSRSIDRFVPVPISAPRHESKNERRQEKRSEEEKPPGVTTYVDDVRRATPIRSASAGINRIATFSYLSVGLLVGWLVG